MLSKSFVHAAYAQFEQVQRGIDPAKPLAVQQWAGLIAINYPARSFGITRFLNLDEAFKKCPELICVHVATYAQGEGETAAKYHENPRPETHKVSLDPYRRESLKILKIFGDVSGAVVEKASIDESFFDLSSPVRDLLLERYGSYLRTPPEGSSLGLDTPLPEPPPIDWTGLGELVPLYGAEGEGGAAANGANPKQADSEGATWGDIALALGAELMAKCRRQVFDELKYTCSAGIARNKMLAKLCSSYRKPANQTILRDAAVLSFLRPLKFQKIRFLGGKLGLQLAEAFSATTVGDLWTVPLEALQKTVGEDSGMWVWEAVRGIDTSQVEMKRETKSMLSAKNFKPAIATWGEGVHWIRVLSTELLLRLQEARENTPGVWPKTIVLHRRNDSYVSTAKQVAFPFTSRLSVDYVLRYALRLLIEFVPGTQNRLADMVDATPLGRVTNLALAFQGLGRVESGQKAIEGFFGTAKAEADDAKGKGKEKEAFVPLAAKRPPPNPDIAAHFQAGDDSSRPGKRQRTPSPAPADLTFTCPRCKDVVRVSHADASASASPGADAEQVMAAALERLKAEHADEHFARDLHDEDRKANRPPEPAPAPARKKAKKAKPEPPKNDIASFFRPAASSSTKKR